MKLKAYYLHGKKYSGVNCSIRPDYFSHEKSFNNFRDTFNSDEDLILIIDGKPDPKTFIDDNNLTKRYFNGGSYASMWRFLIGSIMSDIRSGKIGQNDLVYIVEDDYLHTENWKNDVLDFFNENSISKYGYVTLYDHPDKYFQIDRRHGNVSYVGLTSKILLSNYRHWRSLPACTGSFIVSSKVFSDDFEILFTIDDDGDRSLKLCQEKNRAFFCPIPALATACHSIIFKTQGSDKTFDLMSKLVDWRSIAEKY